MGEHDIKRTVAVVVLTRDEQPLLGFDELDCRLEDQALYVLALCGRPVGGLHPLDLPPQLPAPFPLSLPGSPNALEQLRLPRALALEPAHVPLEPLPVSPLRLPRMRRYRLGVSRPGALVPPAEQGEERRKEQHCTHERRRRAERRSRH